MNPLWFIRNSISSWRTRGGIADFLRRLAWIYSAKLPTPVRRSEWTIGFRYPPPIGRVRLLLRANGGSDAFIHGEVFEHEYYRLPLATAPANILDLGANTGMTTLYFSRVYPRACLACVEPVAGNIRALSRNLQLNSIKAVVFPAAIDPQDGRVRMHIGPSDFGHKVADAREDHRDETVEVDSISVPTLMRGLGWARIGLLKVDIEGHEKILLSRECEWLNLVDAMCIECHDGYYGESDLVSLAERFGFLPPKRLPGIWLLERA